MPASVVLTVGVTVAVWEMRVLHVAAAGLEGVVIAACIVWIVLDATLLLKALAASGAMAVIRDGS